MNGIFKQANKRPRKNIGKTLFDYVGKNVGLETLTIQASLEMKIISAKNKRPHNPLNIMLVKVSFLLVSSIIVRTI